MQKVTLSSKQMKVYVFSQLYNTNSFAFHYVFVSSRREYRMYIIPKHSVLAIQVLRPVQFFLFFVIFLQRKCAVLWGDMAALHYSSLSCPLCVVSRRKRSVAHCYSCSLVASPYSSWELQSNGLGLESVYLLQTLMKTRNKTLVKTEVSGIAAILCAPLIALCNTTCFMIAFCEIYKLCFLSAPWHVPHVRTHNWLCFVW